MKRGSDMQSGGPSCPGNSVLVLFLTSVWSLADLGINVFHVHSWYMGAYLHEKVTVTNVYYGDLNVWVDIRFF